LFGRYISILLLLFSKYITTFISLLFSPWPPILFCIHDYWYSPINNQPILMWSLCVLRYLT